MSTPTSPPPATTATTSSPPYYILFTQAGASTSSNTLGHPTIQYHYADDSPLSLLPQSPDEHVLLLDYDPLSPTQISVASTSESMAVTGLRIQEAPGAAASEEKRNDRMCIIETTSSTDKTLRNDRHHSAQAILAQFKQRNAVLRHALTFNGTQNTVLSPASSKLPEVHELSLKQL
ncbi:hypothetical protein PM082_002979 [Marasmius tenuissimus]|nr:hypothetical protein PM082_002979 [Marasmius tenuissimus]